MSPPIKKVHSPSPHRFICSAGPGFHSGHKSGPGNHSGHKSGSGNHSSSTRDSGSTSSTTNNISGVQKAGDIIYRKGNKSKYPKRN